MRTLATILAALSLVGSACGGNAGSIAVADAETRRSVADATNALGFDLVRELSEEGGNTIVSPVSAAMLLGMLLVGARGATEEAMADTLHVTPGEATNAAYGALLRELRQPGDVTLLAANSLWVVPEFELAPEFVDVASNAYNATAEEVDLGGQEAADRIDAWVEEHTNGLIDQFADALGLPSANAVLVLLNAVYFKGTWTAQFDPDDTEDGTFSTADGRSVTVPMMSLDDRFTYGERDDFAVLRLPYGDDERFAMHVFLPHERDGLADLVATLDADGWRHAIAGLEEHEVTVTMPRLDLQFRADLEPTLVALGMGPAFADDSDFTGISGTNPELTVVAQETRLIVDEVGTEAAAVTGGVVAVSAPPEFHMDRPFLFTISDSADETGVILFLGAVTDPTLERTEVD